MLNHRLTILGSDIDNRDLEIKIYLEGYAGAAVEREGAGDVLQIQWGAGNDKQLPLVYGSQATIKFYCEDDYEFLDLFATSNRDVFCQIYIATVLFWSGFVEPEKWSEPLISPNYETTLAFFDGLGLLKDEDYADENKADYTGYLTPLAILQRILGKTGLSLPLNTKVTIRPSGAVTTADALTQTLINQAAYSGLTCYEVLEQLFTNCRIFQRSGEWYVISNDNLSASSIVCKHYTSAGAADGTKTISTRVTDWFYEDEATLELASPLKQITIIQDYGYNSNIVQNSDFQDFNNGNFDYWTNVGFTSVEQRKLDEDGNKYVLTYGREHTSAWTDPRSKYLVSAAIPVKQTTNIPKFTINYAAMASAINRGAYLFWGIKLTTSTTTYTVGLYLDINGEITYEFYENATVDPLPLPPTKKHTKHFLSADTYIIDKTIQECYLVDEITEHFEKLVITIKDGIPADGDIQIYLFAADTSDTNILGAAFHTVGLSFTDEAGDELATANELILINSEKNNYVPSDLELLNGDVPNIPNAATIYNGAFVLNDGSGAVTTAWKIDGNAATYSYAELMARLLADHLRTVKQQVQGRLANVSPAAIVTFTDSDNPGRVFLESGITFDFRMKSIQGNYIEITTADPTGFTIVSKLTTETTKKETNKGTTQPATAGTDEKVGMITPLYEVVNKPGYLNTDYFTQDIDPDTGRAAIKPRYPLQITGLTLLSTGWTLVGDFYEYDFAKDEITAESIVEVIPDNADIQTVIDAVILPGTDSSAGSVKIYAINEPTADIGITINLNIKQSV